jgi:hypothetical protein
MTLLPAPLPDVLLPAPLVPLPSPRPVVTLELNGAAPNLVEPFFSGKEMEAQQWKYPLSSYLNLCER